MKHASRWLPVLAYMALISYFSSKQGGQLPHWSFMKYDKVLHALEYGGLGFLVCRALEGWRRTPRVLASALFGLLFGVVDEFHQSFVSGRQGNDPGDMAADLVGSLLGAIAFVVLAELVRKKESPAP
jgi:VanZ family protein